MAWNPADHPRGADGRFISKTTVPLIGVVVAVLAALGLTNGDLLRTIDPSSPTSPLPDTWKSRGLTFQTQTDDSPPTCDTTYAYGDVATFLAQHPCSTLQRGLFDATGQAGNSFTVSTATVTMPSNSQAKRLRSLVDQPGTGNVRELAPGFSGKHYASRVDGTTVTIAQAEPDGFKHVPTTALDRAARAALDVPLR